MPQDPQDPYASIAVADPYADIAKPIAAAPSLQQRVEDKLPGTNDTGLKGAAHHIQDTLNYLKGTYDISAPGIAQEIYKKLSGQPNEMKSLPGKMVTGFALAGEPEGEFEPRPKLSPDVAADPEASGMLSRVADVAKRRINNLPGVKAYKDLDYIVRGGDTPPAPKPPSAPQVPENWGKGTYGTPVDQWGQRIPQQQEAPAPIAVQKITPKDIERQLNESLGGQPLKRDVPLKQQIQTQPKPADLPEGHTAVESSAVKSFKYDSDAKELHIRPAGGRTTYVYGDVEPEQADVFTSADSKGQAWHDLRNSSSPVVAKIIDGKRIAVRPVPKPSEDLTGVLIKSLEQARAAKAANP